MTLTNYCRDLADTICQRMTDGESLRSVCQTEGYPSEGTVRGWAARDVDGFGARYRHARDQLLEYWSDEIVDLADRDDLDPRDRQVRIDTRKWLMSKLAPRRYGERLLHASDPENPIQVLHQQVSFDALTPAQLEVLEAFAQSVIEQRLGSGGANDARLLVHQPRRSAA